MIRASRWLICVVTLLSLSFPAAAQQKPALSASDLEKHTHYFDVVDDKIVGEGSAVLAEALHGSQFVLLGEYHNSLRISEFTNALIPILHGNGFRNLALEVGPVSAELLSELSNDPANTVAALRSFNSRYSVRDNDNTYTPIPFFSNVEDAKFLAEARRRNWNLVGLDQEFSFSYLPLIERLYKNLKPREQTRLKNLYEEVNAAIKSFYEADIKREKSLYAAILESKVIHEFLEAAVKDNDANRRIADAIRFTTEIYHLNDASIRKYYQANSGRVAYMKKNLAESFARLRFDPKKDKLLLKMGAVHTGRGFSDLSLFEIGNTLSELAELNGSRSLHIYFGSRFYNNNGRAVDALDESNSFLSRFKGLTQMARRDKWTVIDLRPLRQTVFYARKFQLDNVVLEVFKNHDLFIIPKIEADPTPNY